MQVILHAGFHKTGTSSVQRFLAANRTRLAPAARVLSIRQTSPRYSPNAGGNPTPGSTGAANGNSPNAGGVTG